jgi:hypothetical protein
MAIYKFTTVVFFTLFVVSSSYAFLEHREKVEAERKNVELTFSMQDANDLVTTQVARITNLHKVLEDMSVNYTNLEQHLRISKQKAAVIAQESIKWKGKYMEMKDATQRIIDATEKVVEPAVECTECLARYRMRVDFNKNNDYLSVKGHTMTNPAYAETIIKWTRPVKLSMVIAKDEDSNKFTAYSKSEESDFIPTTVKVLIDDSVTMKPWRKRVSFGADFSVADHSSVIGVNARYDLKGMTIGPNFFVFNHAGNPAKYLGVSVSFYPWS